MQAQSNAYREALYESYVVQSTITGNITAPTGEIYDLTDNDIIPGSLNKIINASTAAVLSWVPCFRGSLT